MQYGPRIVWGQGCPSTSSGAHVIEFNETGSEATCCQCALVLEGDDYIDALRQLPNGSLLDMLGECVERLKTLKPQRKSY